MKKGFLSVVVVMLTSYGASAFQESPLRELKQKLLDYYEKQQPVKVHMFLRQPKYLAGDTIFFKATVVYTNTLKPLEKKSLLNVALTNNEGHLIFSEKVRVKDGIASNQIAIPPTLQPGKYLLVAYHDWMKANPELYSQQYVEIAGEKEFQLLPDLRTMNFYPEGGSLISGTNNKIAVVAVPGSEGKIKDSSGNEVSSFRTDTNGLSFFYLHPRKDEKYTAEVIGNNLKWILPDPVNDKIGVLAKVSDDQSDLHVTVQQSGEAKHSKVRLVINSQSDIYFSSVVGLESGNASVDISLRDRPAGLSLLTVFSENGTVLAERLFFVGSLNSAKTEINQLQTIYTPRERVSFQIKVMDSDGSPLKSHLAVTIFNKDVLLSEEKKIQPAIADDLLLFSDLSGTSSNAWFSFAQDSPGIFKKLDTYLITQQWKRFSWSDVLERKENLAQKHSDLRFTGEVISEKTGEIITDSTFVTFFMQKNIMTYHSFTRKGKFDVSLYNDFYGDDEVFYRVENRGKRVPDGRLRIFPDTAFIFFKKWRYQETQRTDGFYLQSVQQKLIKESFSFYNRKTDYKRISSLSAQIEEEVFGPDIEIDIEKYLIFPTMEETIREIIPAVQHRKVRNENVVRVFLRDLERFGTENPVFIIDGVLTDDVNYFLALKPSQVSKIKIINSRDKLMTFGAISAGGIIIVETKIPDHSAKIPRSKNSFKVHGLNEAASIRAFDPESQSPRVPDLRTSLYWDPQITTNDNGEATISFYTSDVTGEFEIKLEGLTSDNIPFSKNGSFKVEFKSGSH